MSIKMADINVIFLGTGGSVPTPKRGLSAIAVKRKNEILLFDCGEGTQRQLTIAGIKPTKVNKLYIGDNSSNITGWDTNPPPKK